MNTHPDRTDWNETGNDAPEPTTPADNSPISGADRQPHPTDPKRWADGTWKVGGVGGNLRHGVRRYEATGALPLDVQDRVETFRANVENDRGGRSEMSAIELGYANRLAQIEAALELLSLDIRARGVMTGRGRPRVAYRMFLDTLNTWDRFAMRIGLGRRARRVESVEDILREHTERAETGNGDHPCD